MDSGIEGIVMGHAPGQMLVLDMVNEAVCKGEVVGRHLSQDTLRAAALLKLVLKI